MDTQKLKYFIAVAECLSFSEAALNAGISQSATSQQTIEWKDRYRIRAGIEATASELKRSHGIGKLKVRRIAEVWFAVACKVTACNIKRWARALKRLPDGCLSPFCVSVRLNNGRPADRLKIASSPSTFVFLVGTRGLFLCESNHFFLFRLGFRLFIDRAHDGLYMLV